MSCGAGAVVNGRESPEFGRERVEARREAAAEVLLPMTTQAPPEGVGATREMEPRRVWVSGVQPTGRLIARAVWRTIVTPSPLFASPRQTVLLLQLRGPSLRRAVTALPIGKDRCSRMRCVVARWDWTRKRYTSIGGVIAIAGLMAETTVGNAAVTRS